ncbi:MAG: type II toxin-antitoxin system RelE/ParE family toxin [Nitrospinota bacterium]
MVKTFRHKGLEKLFRKGNKAGINTLHAKRIRLILGVLDAARELRDINLPGLKMHKLKGELKGKYAVSVSGNWRIIFRFDGKDVFDVDYVDYH